MENSKQNFIKIEQFAHLTLGRLALDQGLIDARQILEVIKIQHENPQLKFGEILIAQGQITRNQLDELLKFQVNILTSFRKWQHVPDSVLKGFVFFGRIKIITIEDIRQAEQIRESYLLVEKTDQIIARNCY